LPPAEQDRAVRRAEKRKVILSTNVAESSVTIDGVVAVIDAGLARVASHAAWSGLPRLDVQRVSRASAIQRAGRAGRTRPGRCLRLYTNADFESRAEHETPEIRRVDLAQTELELRAAGTTDLAWLEAPPEDSLAAATQLLQRLGAIDDAGATAIGREMARLGVHPRQARILVEAKKRGVAAAACTIAALLGERDIRLAAKTRFDDRRAQHGATERSDLVAMLDAFNEAARARFSASAMRAIGLDVGATMAVERARAHLRRIVRDEEEWDDENALLTSVLAGYPDRVARRLRPGARALALAGGRTAELAESSVVRDAPWMVAVDAEERGRGVAVRVASAIEPEWLIDLFPERIVESRDVAWSSEAERVDAVERMTYDGLAIDESPSNAASEEVSRALAEAAIAKGVRTFAPGLDAWLARARFAASIDSSIAAPTDDDVRAALVEACEGRKSFAELRDAGLLDSIKARVGHAKCATIERLAPERLTLLGGRSAAIEYEEGKPPWTETYLQDFFGMSATPRIGDGRVALVVHLWAPNKRAVQVTSDLSGFWTRHYPAIRKELMRKYQKHNWPEDPTKPAPRFARDRK